MYEESAVEVDRDRTAIENQLERVREQKESLSMVVDRLIDRLAPILTPENERPEDGDSLAAVATNRQSPLAETLAQQADDLGLISERVRRVLGRVDL